MQTFYQGNSVDFAVTVYHEVDDSVVDITGFKIWFTIKTNYADPDSAALLQVTTETGISFVDPVNGLANVSLIPTATQSLPTNVSLHCDVQVRTPAGKVYTTITDTVIVNPKVTDTLDYT